MTPPQQQYIISEEMVQCIEAWTERYPTVSKDIASTIRSRPATTPAPCPQHKVWEHCPVADDIAAKAREGVLKPLQKIKEYDVVYYKTPERGKVRCKVHSVSKNGKRIGIEYRSSSFSGGCSISKGIDISEVISVCREIPLRTSTKERE